MGLSKRQVSAINKIILEEVQSALRGRSQKDEYLRRSHIQERLVEAGPDAMRVDWSIMDSVVERKGEEVAGDMAHDITYKFSRVMYKAIAEIMNQHSMSIVKNDPRTFGEEVEEFDQDGTMDAAHECASDIVDALIKYAKTIGELSVHMAGGMEEDEEYLGEDDQDHDDVKLPPMHPRGRKDLSPKQDDQDHDDVKLPPMHPRSGKRY